MNNRRKLIVILGAGTIATSVASFAQKKPGKIFRIGVLTPATPAATALNREALKQGLQDLGYVEGQNITFEHRYGDGRVERLSDLAAELVRIKVDVIIVASDPGISALKRETQTIPIVMANSADPVGTGFVASLARPGGNVTGISTMSPELNGKRVELLREVVLGLVRLAIIWNPDIRGAVLDYNETVGTARTLRLRLQSVELSRPEDLDRAFSEITKGGAQGLIVVPANPIAFVNRNQIANFAMTHRMPAVFGQIDYVNAGGLMSYGSNPSERWRHVATFVDKILKGSKPSEIPVEQPTKFELAVNLKAAKALGITIPQTILVRADRVIE